MNSVCSWCPGFCSVRTPPHQIPALSRLMAGDGWFMGRVFLWEGLGSGTKVAAIFVEPSITSARRPSVLNIGLFWFVSGLVTAVRPNSFVVFCGNGAGCGRSLWGAVSADGPARDRHYQSVERGRELERGKLRKWGFGGAEGGESKNRGAGVARAADAGVGMLSWHHRHTPSQELPRYEGSWGLHGTRLGPTGPRWTHVGPANLPIRVVWLAAENGLSWCQLFVVTCGNGGHRYDNQRCHQ